MDYSRLFSKDTGNFMRSPVRDIFRKVDLSAICSFAGGYPDAATFPLEDIKELCALVLDKYGARAVQYGATQGVTELREALSARYGVPVANIQISTSSQQGIDVCTRILADPRDVILTTSPTYLGALQSFKSYRAETVPLHGFGEEDCGVAPEVLGRAKFCYVIPDFQNPGGTTMSLDERRRLCALSEKYGFVIVEDAPYRELRYSGEPVPTIWSLAPDRTLHLGTFSKIVAPGMRIGLIACMNPDLYAKLVAYKSTMDLHTNIFGQMVLAEYLLDNDLDAQIEKIKKMYGEKAEKMMDCMSKDFPEGVTFTKPEGGMFIWATLPEGLTAVDVMEYAAKRGVAVCPGDPFYEDDRNQPIRKSHQNPAIQQLYAEYLGEPGSHFAHKLLHTHYSDRSRK